MRQHHTGTRNLAHSQVPKKQLHFLIDSVARRDPRRNRRGKTDLNKGLRLTELVNVFAENKSTTKSTTWDRSLPAEEAQAGREGKNERRKQCEQRVAPFPTIDRIKSHMHYPVNITDVTLFAFHDWRTNQVSREINYPFHASCTNKRPIHVSRKYLLPPLTNKEVGRLISK